jgi:hypothetical protein
MKRLDRFSLACWMLAALSSTAGVAVAQSSSAQGSAHINGKIVDASGKPIAAAKIQYQRLPLVQKDSHGRWHELPGEAHVTSAAPTDAVGAYAATLLPSGSYALCASAPGYLASCAWGASHRANVTTGQQLDFGTITLARAATVTIQLQDPLHLVPSVARIDPLMALGVLDSDRNYHPARLVTSDSNGHTYQVDVPYGTPLSVWFHSLVYRVADGSGTALNSSGTAIPFQAASGAAAPVFTIRVTGKLK